MWVAATALAQPQQQPIVTGNRSDFERIATEFPLVVVHPECPPPKRLGEVTRPCRLGARSAREGQPHPGESLTRAAPRSRFVRPSLGGQWFPKSLAGRLTPRDPGRRGSRGARTSEGRGRTRSSTRLSVEGPDAPPVPQVGAARRGAPRRRPAPPTPSRQGPLDPQPLRSPM
jgi:hypothetical protein